MSISLYKSKKFELSEAGYLSPDVRDKIFSSRSKDVWFGQSQKDSLKIQIHDLNGNKLVDTILTSSNNLIQEKYVYKDIDGNEFDDVINKDSDTWIKSPNGDILISFDDIFKSIVSDENKNVSLSIIPQSDFFTKEDPLTIKEISNSRKEIKLTKSFNFKTEPTELVLEQSDNGLLLNGKKSLKLQRGQLYTIQYKSDITDIRISKIRGGVHNGGVDYKNGIVYKRNSSQILIDTTQEGFPGILNIYSNSIGRDSNIEVLFIETLPSDVTKYNFEFKSLDGSEIICSEIFDELMYGISHINVTELFISAKSKNPDSLTEANRLLAFDSDSQMESLFNSVYFGSRIYDSISRSTLALTGVREYIEYHLKFNYEFSIKRSNLIKEADDILKSVILDRLLRYNKSLLFSNRKNLETCFSFIYQELSKELSSIIDSVFYEYNRKFNGYLKRSLRIKSIDSLILSLKIINSNECWVKLADPIEKSVVVGDRGTIVNLSIAPFLNNVIFENQKKEKRIKLTSPNFSLYDYDSSTKVLSTKYYNGEDLTIEDDLANQIELKKKSIELNIDYSKFENFVVFSSASTRLNLFKRKIITISEIDQEITSLTDIDPSSSATSDSFLVFDKIEELKDTKNDIIKKFDGFETYLYRSEKFIYNPTEGIFSESSGSSEPSSYVEELTTSASFYDKNNRDSLINNCPEFIYTDSDNSDFLTFVSMIGHHFDNLYIHISNIGVYKDVGHSISDGMTGKVVSYVLNSLGFKLPPGLSGLIESSDILENYLTSDQLDGVNNSISIDEKTKTIWKRMLVNLPSIYKSKGTEECIRQILSVYGIPNNLITFKEFGGGYSNTLESSSYFSEDKEYLLEFLGNEDEFILISGSTDPYRTIQFKLHIDPTNYTSSNLIIPIHNSVYDTGEKIYSMGFVKTTNNLGRIYFNIKKDDSTFSTLTSPFNLFSDEPMTVFLKRNYPDKKFDVSESASSVPIKYEIQVYRDSQSGRNVSVNHEFYLSASFNGIFDDYNELYFGNIEEYSDIISEISEILESEDESFTFIKESDSLSGFTNQSYPNYSIQKFKGCLDKINIWRIPLTEDVCFINSRNVGYYSSNHPSSSYNDTIFRFDLGIPTDISSASFTDLGYVLENKNKKYSGSSAYLYNFSGSNVTQSLYTSSCVTSSFSDFPHQTKEFLLTNEFITNYVGPGRFENRKISHIPNTDSQIELSPNRSSVKKSIFSRNQDSNRLGIFISPVFERNKDILNFFGNYDIMESVANPNTRNKRGYLELDELRSFYAKENYHGRLLFNELFSIYKIFIDKSFFETINSVIPVRSKIYTGILIEPTILERNRIESDNINLSEISVLSASADVVRRFEVNSIPMFSSSLEISSRNYTQYGSESPFVGFGTFLDRHNEYQTNILLNGDNNLVEYGGEEYWAFEKKHVVSRYSGQNITRKTTHSVSLILSGSSFITGSNLSSINDRNKFRPIGRKNLPFRKTKNKSKQTDKTTVSSGETRENPSPVISISIGPDIQNSILR